MIRKLFYLLILTLVISNAPLNSFAWGTQGHRICGQIADAYLSPATKKAIKDILGNESLALAGNWADFIKSDPNYNYLYNWHFIDFDKPYTYPQMQDYLARDTTTDAYTKLQFVTAQLKKKGLSKQNKLLYLHMLIHIIEDVHQPMHTAHADDKGGNEFKVKWFNADSNLHSVWDSQLIDFQQLSYTEYTAAINHITQAQRNAWQKAPISEWLFESNQIAEKLYTEIKPGDTLEYKYNFSHIEILNQQLLKAGVRLAGVLNSLFT